MTDDSSPCICREGQDAGAVYARAMRGRASSNWREADVLIIDEVSMLSAELWSLLDYIARRAREDMRYDLFTTALRLLLL